MNVDHAQRGNGKIVFGDVLPGSTPVASRHHLYVSLADLIADVIFYHPSIATHMDQLAPQDKSALDAILNHQSVNTHFVDTLVARILEQTGAANYQTIQVCLSNFDSYDYQALLGGQMIESAEINPALGLRGVSRYASDAYKAAFSLECDVIKALQHKGLEIEIVVPFVRGLSDAATIIDRLAENGLPRGIKHLKVSYSCDVPAGALLAERLLQYFDGLVINIDHLTQFTLGLDKYNEALRYLYEPENEAVIALVDTAVKAAHMARKPAVFVIQADDDSKRWNHYLSDAVAADVVFVC